jgi:cis-3-alkyl-4-acyloxetan-2-one decarboxylase
MVPAVTTSVTALPDWIEAQLPSGVRRQIVDAADQRVHVMEWGPADGQTVVLLHGNPTWGFLWRKVVAAIRARPGGERLRLVVPDLVGLGLSSKPEGAAYSLRDHATWMGEALDRVAPGPLVLVAQDWGGPIGLLAMAARRARLRGVVLGNTAVSPPAPSFKPTLFHRLAQLPVVSNVLFERLGFPLGVLHLSQGDRSSIRGDVARAYRWPLAKRADRAAPLALARMVPNHVERHPSIPPFHELDAFFRELQVPIHLVWGTRDPILGRVVNHLERTRPDATVVRTQAGHFLQEEVPESLADAVMTAVGQARWSSAA